MADAGVRPGSTLTETSDGGVTKITGADSTVAGDMAEEVMGNMVDQLLEMCGPAPDASAAAAQSAAGTKPPTSQGVSSVAGEVAQDMLSAMVDQMLGDSGTSVPGSADGVLPEGAESWPGEAKTRVVQLKGLIDQLSSELGSARRELDSATAEKEELFRKQQEGLRNATAARGTKQKHQDDLKRQVAEIAGIRENASLRALEVDSLSKENQATKAERDALQVELDSLSSKSGAALPAGGEISAAQHSLQDEVESLMTRAQGLEEEKLHLKQQQRSMLEGGPTGSTMAPFGSAELAATADPQLLLQAAYQQISVLNTQMAHLYTELTMARTELVSLRGDGETGLETSRNFGNMQLEEEKRNDQVADLVSDIRHLQLDLEYHQQKLDQMIEDKRETLGEIRLKDQMLREVHAALADRDREIQHKELDLQKSSLEANSRSQSPSGRGGGGMAELDATAAALRSEGAAKDSALIVSHYEVHKERVVRERLEGKNLKLMERLQKLMLVVENQRRDAQRVEERLVAADKICADKDRQLADVSTKARQVQKLLKTQGVKDAGGAVVRGAGPRQGAKTGRTPRSTTQSPRKSNPVPESLPGIAMGWGNNPALAETY